MNHDIYLALGTNLGDRLDNLRHALRALQNSVNLSRVSACYDTAPWGMTDQPRFLNLACCGETTLSPQALLAFVKGIEAGMGRRKGIRYGPRVIDIDVLFYDDLIHDEEGLVIPHPRLHERAFVLVPLADIAPEKVHPITKQQMVDMLQSVDKQGIERVSVDLSDVID